MVGRRTGADAGVGTEQGELRPDLVEETENQARPQGSLGPSSRQERPTQRDGEEAKQSLGEGGCFRCARTDAPCGRERSSDEDEDGGRIRPTGDEIFEEGSGDGRNKI
jgi:hypothetical protein